MQQLNRSVPCGLGPCLLHVCVLLTEHKIKFCGWLDNCLNLVSHFQKMYGHLYRHSCMFYLLQGLTKAVSKFCSKQVIQSSYHCLDSLFVYLDYLHCRKAPLKLAEQLELPPHRMYWAFPGKGRQYVRTHVWLSVLPCLMLFWLETDRWPIVVLCSD